MTRITPQIQEISTMAREAKRAIIITKKQQHKGVLTLAIVKHARWFFTSVGFYIYPIQLFPTRLFSVDTR